MVRSSGRRADKYKAKIDGGIIGGRYEDTKQLAVDGEKDYFVKASKLESQVKVVVDGEPSFLQHFYIAYAEELIKKKTKAEERIVYDKWKSRGLLPEKLDEIAEAIAPGAIPEPERFEYHTSNESSHDGFYRTDWRTQVFTVGAVGLNRNFNITSIKLKLFKIGLTGPVIVSIRKVSGEAPTGPDLSVGGTTGDLITSGAPGAWHDISMSSYQLEASTKYAIVLRTTIGDGSHWLGWRRDEVSGYPAGWKGSSINGGNNWTMYDPAIDPTLGHFMFEIFGIID